MSNKYKGSSFDDFLEKENLLESVEAVAVRRLLSVELLKAMRIEHLTKIEMAERMQRSGAGLERLLDPSNTLIILRTLVKAVRVLGKKLQLHLVAS